MATIQPSFGDFHDADGRPARPVPHAQQPDTFNLPVKTNERLRLRMVNMANARIFQVRIEHACA